MQSVEFCKLYSTLPRKQKDKITLWKNFPSTDNYTNTQINNIHEIWVQYMELGLMAENPTLHYQIATP